MTAYIAMLRGINVSGQKIIAMAELHKMFVKLGHKDAKTFIQSGNVVFTSAGKDAGKLAKSIEAAIEKAFGFEVPVILRNLESMRASLASNPYGKRKLAENERLYISWLETVPAKEATSKLEALADAKDELKVKGSEVFLLIRDGYGRSVLNNNFIEKKLGLRATTRNLESSRKLVALAETL